MNDTNRSGYSIAGGVVPAMSPTAWFGERQHALDCFKKESHILQGWS
jgi:hypothetical protein